MIQPPHSSNRPHFLILVTVLRKNLFFCSKLCLIKYCINFYRNPDATCNNLENPLWASTNQAFQRTLLPQYDDGVWRPKIVSATGTTELPSARLVSVSVVPDFDAPSELDTHNVMQWGQFVDHDTTHTPLFRLSYGQRDGIKCCKDDGSGPISQLILHPECFPIGKSQYMSIMIEPIGPNFLNRLRVKLVFQNSN